MLHRALALASIAFVLSILISTSAMATTQRTFVASTGNDAGPCSLVAPCRSFETAVAQVNPGGEVIVLDSAGYGAIHISKSMTIAAPAGVYAGITPPSGDTAVTIIAGASDVVTLRGLTLHGLSGTGSWGVVAVGVGTLQIDKCIVSEFFNGIDINAPNNQTFIKDTIVRQNFGYGMRFFNGRIVIDNSRIEDNGSYGVDVANADVTMRGTTVIGNATGVAAESDGPDATIVTINGSMVANNRTDGVEAVVFSGGSSATVRVANSAIIGNKGYGLWGGGVVVGQVIESQGTNLIRGNVLGDVFGSLALVGPQ